MKLGVNLVPRAADLKYANGARYKFWYDWGVGDERVFTNS